MEIETESNLEELKDISQRMTEGNATDDHLATTMEGDQDPEDLVGEVRRVQGEYPDPEDHDISKKDGLWMYHGTRLWIPPDTALRKKLLREFHDSPTAGHFGRDRTIMAMKRLIYWKGMNTDVEDYVGSCLACQKNKPSRKLTPGELEPIPVPGRSWGSISLDLITDLPPSKRSGDFPDKKGGSTPTYDAELVIVDRLTKEVEFIPVRKDMTSKQFAHVFLKHVFSKHGMPDDITSDRAALFTSEFWETFSELVGTKRKISTSFHPQTDGLTERMNATLECYWRTFVNFEQNNWADWSDLAEFCWNNSPSPITGISPFEANGKTVKPVEVKHLLNYTSESARQLADRLKELQDNLKEILTHAQDTQAKYYDAKHRPLEFKVGDQVMLNVRNMGSNRPCKKLSSKYEGRFRVEERIGNQAYRLKLPTSWRCHDVFHVSLLTPYRGASREVRDVTEEEPGPDLIMNDVGEENEE